MRLAVEGYLATDHMKLNEDEVTSKKKTISGWVRNIPVQLTYWFIKVK